MNEAQDLLVEIGTEELPPTSLEALSEAFHSAVCAGLEKHGLNYRIATPYATPRRLAVLARGVDSRQPEQHVERRGPALRAAFDADGQPTNAARGFARSCGVEIGDLEELRTDKGEWLVYRVIQAGRPTRELLPEIIREALDSLPIAKRMRWGANEFDFVRPVHWVVLMLGEDVVESEFFGVRANRMTAGHRFHHPDPIHLREAGDYARMLEKHGWVLPLFSSRRERVSILVREAAELQGGMAVIDDDLLNEVTSLVEWPQAVVGHFDEEFLEVPPECLIATMKGNQKYFHLVDLDNKLLPYFIAISNIESRDPEIIKAGNERVIRPRLADAKFFWDRDSAHPLESRWEKLKNVIFEVRLGSLYDKSRRIASLAGEIARQLGGDEFLAIRAGQLCKCDLLSDMVGEFPELQGIMGEYYARRDGENEAVAVALREHYLPRYWGDQLPATRLGQAVALADRLDTLVGIFGLGQGPTGDRDPFGLRRAALGVLRIITEGELPLDLPDLLERAAAAYPAGLLPPEVGDQVFDFMLERMKGYYAEQGAPQDSTDAVLSCRPRRPHDARLRVMGVEAFRGLPAAESLAAANKRIHNILKKAGEEIPGAADPTYFKHARERALYDRLREVAELMEPRVAEGDYSHALEHLAELREAVDGFFDEVMVMDENPVVRRNRLALLQTLRALFLRVADVSMLRI